MARFRINRRRRALVVLTLAVTPLVGANPGHANVWYYVGGTTGQWGQSSSWNTNPAGTATFGVPASGDYVEIFANGAHTVNFNVSSSSLQSLMIDDVAGTNTLTMLTAASLTNNSTLYLGPNGSGAIQQSAGTNTINAGGLNLGNNVNGNGVYTLNGGSLVDNGGDASYNGEYIGNSGSGTFNQTGGTNTLGTTSTNENLVIGNSTTAGMYGSYLLNNTSTGISTLNVNGNEYVAYSAPGTSTGGVITRYGGTFNQSGGTHNVTGFLILGQTTTATGSYLLSGGNLNVGTTGTAETHNEVVGYNGSAIFTQTGGNSNVGSLTTTQDLYVGYAIGVTGVYTQSSATSASTLSVTGNEFIGYSAGNVSNNVVTQYGGIFNQSNGSHTVYGTLSIGTNAGSAGLFQLSGGIDYANAVIIGGSGNGAFNQSGGNIGFSTMVIGASANSIGSYTLSGANAGLTVTGTEYVGQSATGNSSGNTITQYGAVFNQSGGIHDAQSLYIGSNVNSTALYLLSGGSLNVTGSELVGSAGTGIFVQTGGSHVIGTVGNTSLLQIGNNTTSTGSYTLSNTSGPSSLVVYGSESIGVGTGGVFNQLGGTHFVSGGLQIGVTNGTFNLSGGSVTAGAVSVGNFGGIGILNVTGSAVLTATGGLTAYGSVGTAVNLNGGTINTSALNFFGVPSQFNWSAGTLNLTTSVIWDSQSSNTTSVAFGSSLALGNNQILSINGNETIGGTGPFVLTLNSGSTHIVSGTVVLTSTGTLTNNTGSTFYFSGFNQAGGTINGTLQNTGVFTYQSGVFNGRLINQGTASLGISFTAANGIENDNSLGTTAGQTVMVNGAGLDNLGTYNLSGGTISGTGPVLNDLGGQMYAQGTINTSLTNQGNFTVTGVLRLNNATPASNLGLINGSGTVIGALNNNGTIQVGATSLLAINSAWTNSGLVNLIGSGGVLNGGTITNLRTIQGFGTINAVINNSTGVIRASGGELDLGGTGDLNGTSAQIEATTANTVLFIQGLATNAGTIALAGGAFDNNNQPLNNTGTINGNGIVRTGGLTIASSGLLLLTDAASSVYGPVTNAVGGNIKIVSNTTDFYGAVINNGTVKVSSGVARFLGNGVSMTVGGTYNSDPSDNYFNGLAVTSTGTVLGGSGDRFFLTSGTALTNSGNWNVTGTLSANTVTNTGTFTQTGTLVEAGNFTTSGTATIGGTQNWSSGTTFSNTAGSATFKSDTGSAIASPLAVNLSGGSVTFSSVQHLASLTIGTGLTASVSGTSQKALLLTPTLSDAGTLDLTTNGLDVQGGSLPAVRSLVAQGYNNGHWTGSGITSSTTIPGLTALGEILNNVGGSPLYTTFDNAAVGLNDVLVKYTYYGDATLDGKVDGTDYSRIDAGYLSHATGWFNGDFNYDGVINGSDYTLIDNAFNTQGGSLASAVADPLASAATQTVAPAVPEPATLSIMGMAVIGLLGRRAHRSRV